MRRMLGVRLQRSASRRRRLGAWWLALALATALPRAFGDDAAVLALREDALAAAIGGSADTLEELLAADFFYNTARGTALTKPAMIAQLASGAVRVRSIAREDVVTKVYGETALVSGVARVTAVVEGEEVDMASRYLHVWVRQRDTWRLAARQVTPLSR